MSDLGADLARAYEARVAATDVELTPAAIRAVVRELGGGEGRAQVAAGNKELAGQLGVSVRTVQRWQKEGGEARSVARSTPGLWISVQGIATAQQRAANARTFRERVQEQGLDVAPCRVMVKVYNEDRARPRSIGAQHIGGGRANRGAGRAGRGRRGGGSRRVRARVVRNLRDGRGCRGDGRGGDVGRKLMTINKLTLSLYAIEPIHIPYN